MIDLNDVVIIFQGYSVNDQQLMDQLEYYDQLGFKNIVISTYKRFVENVKLPSHIKLVLNDDYDELELVNAKTNGKCTFDLGIKFEEPCFPETQPNWEKVINHKFWKKLRIINLQLQTTKRGIKLANESFPNAKYYLKLRLDMRIPDLDNKIQTWIPKITVNNVNENRVYDHKLVVYNWENQPWYLRDYWIFGYKEDIIKFFSIPFVKTNKDVVFTQRAIVESYLASTYFKMKLGSLRKINFNRVVKDYFIFDPTVIKYNPRHLGLLPKKIKK